MTLVVAFVLGVLIGVAVAPLLHAYVRWKAAQAYALRGALDDDPERSSVLRDESR